MVITSPSNPYPRMSARPPYPIPTYTIHQGDAYVIFLGTPRDTRYLGTGVTNDQTQMRTVHQLNLKPVLVAFHSERVAVAVPVKPPSVLPDVEVRVEPIGNNLRFCLCQRTGVAGKQLVTTVAVEDDRDKLLRKFCNVICGEGPKDLRTAPRIDRGFLGSQATLPPSGGSRGETCDSTLRPVGRTFARHKPCLQSPWSASVTGPLNS